MGAIRRRMPRPYSRIDSSGAKASYTASICSGLSTLTIGCAFSEAKEYMRVPLRMKSTNMWPEMLAANLRMLDVDF
jgi:hypothetical protein